MYYSAGVAKPVMLVLNSSAAGGSGVRAAQFNPATGAFVSLEVIDALAASFGTRLAADFDRNGHVVAAVYDLTTTRVRYSHSEDGRTWLPSSPQITTAPLGREGLDIRLDRTAGRPAVTYYDRANNALHMSSCTSDFVDCSSAGNWTTTSVATGLGLSGIAVANEKLLNTSLTFSAEGTPYVSYMTGIAASTQSLAVADKESGSFATTSLSDAPASAVNGAAAVNHAMTGFHLASVRTRSGALVTTYVGPNNWLYATSCEP